MKLEIKQEMFVKRVKKCQEFIKQEEEIQISDVKG